MATGTSRRLLEGSALRVTALVAGMVPAFYVMPFLVHTLGDRWYGFWGLVGSIVGYYSLLDLGLSNSAHRFLALARGRGDQHETNQVFTTALLLFSVGGVCSFAMMGIVWVGVPFFAKAPDVGTLRTLVLLLGANLAISFPVAVFYGVLTANLRYDLTSYIYIVKVLVRTVIVVIILSRIPSVVALAWITLVVEVTANAGVALAAFRVCPGLRATLRLYDRARVRPFFGFGLYAFLVRVGDLVRFGVDNVVIAGLISVSAVTHYGIAMRLTSYFQDVLVNALDVLLPVFSRFHGADERQALIKGVRQASRLAVALAGSLAGAAIIFGIPFIRRWMGQPYLDAYWPLVILVLAATLSVMQTPSTSYLYAVARHRYYAALNGADAAVNLLLSIILARRYGIIGVAVGTAVPTAVVKLVLQPRYVCSELGYSVSDYWKELGRILLGTAVLQLPIAMVVWFVHPASYPTIIGLATGLYSAHLILLYLFILSREDQETLARAFPLLLPLVETRRRVTALVSDTLR